MCMYHVFAFSWRRMAKSYLCEGDLHSSLAMSKGRIEVAVALSSPPAADGRKT
jgi:hypothetical protein